jgi:hypothetical protein
MDRHTWGKEALDVVLAVLDAGHNARGRTFRRQFAEVTHDGRHAFVGDVGADLGTTVRIDAALHLSRLANG